MPSDFNERPIRVSGGFPESPCPVDISVYGWCSFGCGYCFANLNRTAHAKELHLTSTVGALFRQIASAMANDVDPIGYFLREQYPVRLSNTTDPFQPFERKHRATEAVLKWLASEKIPFVLQTRGAEVLLKDWDRYADYFKPGQCVLYTSYCQMEEASHKAEEPGVPSLERCREMIRAFVSIGVPVIVACNPYHRRWVPDAEAYLTVMKDCGVSAVFMDPLHLNGTQIQVLGSKSQHLKGMGDLANVHARKAIEGWYDAAERIGISFTPRSQWNQCFGVRSDTIEGLEPSWWGGRMWWQVQEMCNEISRQAFAMLQGENRVLTWDAIANALEYLDVPNPVFDTEKAWVFYNSSVKGDHTAWLGALGKRANLHEIFRYGWNNPHESEAFLWTCPQLHEIVEGGDDQPVLDGGGNRMAAILPTKCPGYSATIYAEYIDEFDLCELVSTEKSEHGERHAGITHDA